MELELVSQGAENYLKKYLFNLKTYHNDGLLLKVFQSYLDFNKERKKSKFRQITFNDLGSQIAMADQNGSIFVIELDMEKYWQLPNIGNPVLISFIAVKEYELLISLDTCSIVFLHIESGKITGALDGHTAPATEVSYTDDGYYCLTASSVEAIVWEMSSCAQVHRLSLKAEKSLKKVIFMPVTNYILGCCQDDSIHIWQFGTFECIKQIIPETWKTHHLRAIALTKNGRVMVIGGQTTSLVIFCLDTWTIKKVVTFPDNMCGIRQLEFVPQVFDGGQNKILAILTTTLEIYFFDIETSVLLKGLNEIFGVSGKIAVSLSGKYLATILTTGEINIYALEKILSSKKDMFEDGNKRSEKESIKEMLSGRNQTSQSRKTQNSMATLTSIRRQIKELLNVKKLQPILKQFGEYPESYRELIWKSILQLPHNQESFLSLSLKKCHPSYADLESKYPLVNRSLCNSLKKLLSNLSYWCPLFSEVNFLPEFVFPFVKLFHLDPLGCFEVTATVIVNWCQNWFEFYPFPPINMLSTVENVLGYHDPDLLEFYFKNNITTSVSVCPLFHTAFSEVLSKNEWLKLWDHILSNEPSFLFMAIVAYNIICRNAIMNFKDTDKIETFFRMQNPINMKTLISKTYYYLKETPDDLHPRKFFSSFRPLSSGGTYTVFQAYPKLILDSNVEKLQSIREEEKDILEEQRKLLSMRQQLDKKSRSDVQIEEKERIYKELEEKIRKTVEDEEDRIFTQRLKLQNLRQELRLRELEVLEGVRDKALKEKLKKKEVEFDRLLKDISRRKAREQFEIDMMEEEVRKYYSELLLKKQQLELELDCAGIGQPDALKNLEVCRDKLKKDLCQLQNDWASMQHNKQLEISNKVAFIKSLICDMENEIAKEMAEKKIKVRSSPEMKNLKKKVKGLEKEIEILLTKKLNAIRNKDYDKDSVSSIEERQISQKENGVDENKPGSISSDSGASKKKDQKDSKNLRKGIKTKSKQNIRGVRKNSVKIKKEKNLKLKKSDTKENKSPETHTTILKSEPIFKKPTDCWRLTISEEAKNSENIFNNLENRPSHENNWSDDEKKFYRHLVKCDGEPKVKKWGITTSRSHCPKDYSFNSDNENEIFKTALKIRQQLIEDAKLRKNYQ